MTELLSAVADESRDAARYLEGATMADGVAFDSPAAMIERAVAAAFRESGELRAIAALSRIEADETTVDLADAANITREAAATYRDRYADRIRNDGEFETELLAELNLSAETADRVRDVVRSGVASEASVLAFAVEHYVENHEAIRHAAVAARYAEGRMTTGRASDLAGVRKGPEIESLLWDHGVEPRVGPSSDPEQWRAERAAARRAFGADDADSADDVDSTDGADDEVDGSEPSHRTDDSDPEAGSDEEDGVESDDETSNVDRT